VAAASHPAAGRPGRAAALVDEPPLEPQLRDVVRRSAPRVARDAFGPLLAFFVGWKLAGLYVGIAAAVAVAVLLYGYERRRGRPGFVVRLSLGLVLIRAAVGLITGSTSTYLGQEIAIDCILSAVFLGSLAIHRPITEVFARDVFPLPDGVRASPEYRRLFTLIGAVWGTYFLCRAAVRGIAFVTLSKELYLAVVAASDVPFLLGLLAWSVWFGARRLRDSEHWPAIVAAAEAAPGAR
jgi:intracellular septation protein A